MKLTPNIKALIEASKERKEKFSKMYNKDKDDLGWGEMVLTDCCKFYFQFPGPPQNNFCDNCMREAKELDQGDPIWQEVMEEGFMDENGDLTDDDTMNPLKVLKILNPEGIASPEMISQISFSSIHLVKGWDDEMNIVRATKKTTMKTLADVQKRLKGKV